MGLCSRAFSANYGVCLITRGELRATNEGIWIVWDDGARRECSFKIDSQKVISILLIEGEITHQHTVEVLRF
ncbi:hypothetical protein LINPERPRIM_LOCUS21331 [Linum perenne]